MKRTQQLITSLFVMLCCCTGAWATGELNGLFTINASGDMVQFSQGNLQYFCSTSAPEWRFAEHQYDYVTFDISAYAANSEKWIDLFAHGTSGYNNGQANYQPYVVGAASNTYYQGNLTGNADWGYNAISNGGNTENIGWRTLTRDEWLYVFSGRSNAASKYGHGSINGTNGMILLPDSWTLPYGLSFTSGNSAWTNSYTLEQWSLMENAGAVFLPASGSCNNTGIPGESSQNLNGFYRASTAAYYMHFRQSTLENCTMSFYQYGDAVRLVKDYQLQQDAEGNYLLSTAQDMRAFAALVNGGNNTANAKVMNDIDLAGDDDNQWTPIGTNSNWYNGTFDGQGYTIKNLYWHSTVNGVVGLFAYADGATIKNIRVEGDMDNNSNSTTTGEQHTGGIVGYSRNSTLIINCSFAGTAKFLYDGGGIVGLGNSHIINCYNEGTISFPSKTNYAGGGILGYTRDGATIVNCYNTGSIISTLNSTGYIYPIGDGTLNSCYYRESCVKNGQNAGWSNGYGGGTAMSADDMKSAAFVATLNENVAALKSAYPDISEWVQDPVTNLPMLKIFANTAYTVPSSGIGTFSAKAKFAVPDGLTAHYCKAYDKEKGTISVVAIEGAVPANTGVLLKGTPGETYMLTGTNDDAATVTDNALVAVTEATHVDPTSGDYTNFMMSGGKFIRIASSAADVKMPANRAYLQILTSALPSDPAQARDIVLSWDEEDPTEISEVRGKKEDVRGEIYNLSGQRVSKPTKGLYIIGGKKVFIY